MLSFFVVLFFSGFLSITSAWGMDAAQTNPGNPPLEISQILQNIEKLSNESFKGRQAGTSGGEQTAQFVANQYNAMGLISVIPATNESPSLQWFQDSPLSGRHILAPTLVNIFSSQNPGQRSSSSLQIGKDYLPILDSPAVNLTAPIIFVGYGISDPARGVDAYRDLNVRNRTVLFLRGKPSSYPRWITLEEKVQTAQEKGAAGFLTVTGPLLSRYEKRKGLGQIPLAMYSSTPDDRPIPGAWINGETLDQQLSTIQESLETLQHKANANPGRVSRPLPFVAHLAWETQEETGALRNVIGMIPGNDPILRDEIILIGAHRDHFGEQAGLVFPGADDNASGTAVMLEVAELFTEEGKGPKRSILFVSFDGEERGLLGSKHYVNNPARPLNQTIAMINLDHVGVGNGTLTVGVTHSDKLVAQEAANLVGLREKIKVYGYFPGGDHVPFYKRDVPTITVVSAGVHSHFHQPSDTSKEIDPNIVSTATKYVMSLVNLLANPS